MPLIHRTTLTYTSTSASGTGTPSAVMPPMTKVKISAQPNSVPNTRKAFMGGCPRNFLGTGADYYQTCNRRIKIIPRNDLQSTV